MQQDVVLEPESKVMHESVCKKKTDCVWVLTASLSGVTCVPLSTVLTLEG